MRVSSLLAQCAMLSAAAAAPFSGTPIDENSFSPAHALVARQAGKPILRIMPLGASITLGIGDVPKGEENGYRKPLRDEFRARGHTVNMVGCVETGHGFADRQHEGHPGALTEQMKGFAQCSIHFKPNIVLINAGTNDVTASDSRGGLPFLQAAYDRMNDIVQFVFAESEGTTVILSTLLPRGDPAMDAKTVIINERYRQLVTDLRARGQNIYLAEMHDGFIRTDELVDGTHPNHDTFPKMSAVWAFVIGNALAEGKVRDPIRLPDVGPFPDDGPIVSPNLPKYP